MNSGADRKVCYFPVSPCVFFRFVEKAAPVVHGKITAEDSGFVMDRIRHFFPMIRNTRMLSAISWSFRFLLPEQT